MNKEIKINMGCGKRNFGKDWIHIDGGEFPHLHSHNVKKLPFKKNSIDLIYSSHMIEYFDREEIIPILKEWHRVLKPGSTLRVAVPDFRAMSSTYKGTLSSRRCSLKLFLGPLFGKMKMGDETIYHKTVYDFRDLREVLNKCGFDDVQVYNWRDTEPHNKIDDHSQSYIPRRSFVPTKKEPFDKEMGYLISLNVECVTLK